MANLESDAFVFFGATGDLARSSFPISAECLFIGFCATPTCLRFGLIGPKHGTRLHWAANRHGTRRNCLDVDKTAVSQ
jgi:hypothetical protein